MTDLKDLTENGTTLVVSVDPDKTPMFVLKDGVWENTEIGGPATAEQLQAYLDANELAVGDVIDVPAPEPVVEAPTTITAATLAEYNDFLDAADAGTQLVIGEETVTKDGEGNWLRSSGLSQRPTALYFLKDKVTVTTGEIPEAKPVEEVPAVEPEPVEEPKTEPVVEETPIENVVLDDEDLPDESLTEEDLALLAEGDLVTYSSDRGVTQFSRAADGTWVSELTGGHYGTTMLLSVTSRGKLFLSDDTPTVEVGTKHYPESAVKIALTALEAHSGFQVAYALKPINSPLLEQDLVGLAKTEHPDAATTKFAVISMLKSKLGIEEPKDDTPIVHLSGKPELEFTTKQVEDAIEILESYSGKLFRNELVTKGSPIAALSANELIGFHKDKIEGKKAFIEMLRSSLQK